MKLLIYSQLTPCSWFHTPHMGMGAFHYLVLKEWCLIYIRCTIPICFTALSHIVLPRFSAILTHSHCTLSACCHHLPWLPHFAHCPPPRCLTPHRACYRCAFSACAAARLAPHRCLRATACPHHTARCHVAHCLRALPRATRCAAPPPMEVGGWLPHCYWKWCSSPIDWIPLHSVRHSHLLILFGQVICCWLMMMMMMMMIDKLLLWLVWLTVIINWWDDDEN